MILIYFSIVITHFGWIFHISLSFFHCFSFFLDPMRQLWFNEASSASPKLIKSSKTTTNIWIRTISIIFSHPWAKLYTGGRVHFSFFTRMMPPRLIDDSARWKANERRSRSFHSHKVRWSFQESRPRSSEKKHIEKLFWKMLIMKGMKFSNLPTSLHSDIAHLREASGPGETQQGSFYFFWGEREETRRIGVYEMLALIGWYLILLWR